MAVGLIIAVDLRFLAEVNGTLASVFSSLLVVLAVFCLMTLIFLFPVYVHYDVVWHQCLKHALLIGMLRPLYLVAIIFGLVVSYWVLLQFIPLLFFFGASLGALIIMGISYRLFYEVIQ